HPQRRKLAGREAGALFDELADVARGLERGEDGTGKLLTLTPATLRAIAERRPANEGDLARIKGMDDARMDRFGAAILSCLHSL
ncbi:MAG: ATP-dependent DNA helicase RecQ, partial [Alphaproteobacteria bacterium]|nr:ATP-dependent DNA helicase RecQ [Alphaproteobacteria bacterium]